MGYDGHALAEHLGGDENCQFIVFDEQANFSGEVYGTVSGKGSVFESDVQPANLSLGFQLACFDASKFSGDEFGQVADLRLKQ
jgi:hypothetical protein